MSYDIKLKASPAGKKVGFVDCENHFLERNPKYSEMYQENGMKGWATNKMPKNTGERPNRGITVEKQGSAMKYTIDKKLTWLTLIS